MAVQTGDVQADPHEPQPNPPDRPLLYAALLGSKAEATEAIKILLAKINDDHENLPHTLYFRLRSDKGGNFSVKNSRNIVVIMPYTRPQPKDTTQTQTQPLNLV